jgi:hypothetical protein
MPKLLSLLTISVFALAGLSGAQTPGAAMLTDVTMRGTVILPDGSPAKRAEVLVQNVCSDGTGYLTKRIQTDESGSFSILSFSPDCADYLFKASLTREMWLLTGSGVFYLHPNGTTPTVHLERGVAPEPVTIRLDSKGGEAELRVLDKASGSYLEANITLMRTGPERHVTGLVSFVVGYGDSGDVRLLPQGKYRVEVHRYICSLKHISLARPPGLDFVVAAGERRPVVVVLDTRAVKVRATYDNPDASRCTP